MYARHLSAGDESTDTSGADDPSRDAGQRPHQVDLEEAIEAIFPEKWERFEEEDEDAEECRPWCGWEGCEVCEG